MVTTKKKLLADTPKGRNQCMPPNTQKKSQKENKRGRKE
jgi:hypothetical protein